MAMTTQAASTEVLPEVLDWATPLRPQTPPGWYVPEEVEEEEEEEEE